MESGVWGGGGRWSRLRRRINWTRGRERLGLACLVWLAVWKDGGGMRWDAMGWDGKKDAAIWLPTYPHRVYTDGRQIEYGIVQSCTIRQPTGLDCTETGKITQVLVACICSSPLRSSLWSQAQRCATPDRAQTDHMQLRLRCIISCTVSLGREGK